MPGPPPVDARRPGPANLVPLDVTPELLVCTALVRCGVADGAGASLLLGPGDRIGLAATDETFAANAEMQFSHWEGPGPEVVQGGLPVVVEDLHAEGRRWPLTTPHAAATAMRGLATLPLPTRRGVIGLFAAYRSRPGPFSGTDLEVLRATAATLGALADTRFDESEAALHAPPPTLTIAVGMVMARQGLGPDDALALLRARAFALSTSAPTLARRLTSGEVTLDDVLGPREAGSDPSR